MRRSKQMLLALGLGAVAVGGGVGLVEATTSSSTAAPATASKTAADPVGSATVNVTTTKVAGQSEQILVNARGLPLYTYGPDTPTQSHVSGGLAALWPPLVSASPNEAGATGTLSVLSDANGQQVRYNGHFLYTFIDDTPGQVTGQGVQGFFVATPTLSAGSPNAAPRPPRQSRQPTPTPTATATDADPALEPAAHRRGRAWTETTWAERRRLESYRGPVRSGPGTNDRRP